MKAKPLAVLVGAVALSFPAAAAAVPDVQVARTCAYEGTEVPLSATGLPASVPYTATAGQKTVATGVTDAAGQVVATFDAPAVKGQKSLPVTVTAGDQTGTARFYSTDFAVNVTPGSGKPARRVRIGFFGWGPGNTIYLHYVAPGTNKSVRTRRLGNVGGPCGKGLVRLRRFYPFAPRTGTWILQFDTKRRYSRSNEPRIRFESDIFRN